MRRLVGYAVVALVGFLVGGLIEANRAADAFEPEPEYSGEAWSRWTSPTTASTHANVAGYTHVLRSN